MYSGPWQSRTRGIEKARHSLHQPGDQAPVRHDFILLKADKKLYKVPLSEIISVEAAGDYLKVLYGDKHLVVHGTISGILAKLPPEDFIRVHRSFVIALNRISYVEGNRIRIGSAFIPIGRSYNEEVERRLNQR